MQNSTKKSLKVCLPFFVFFIGLTFFVKDNAFFWDTVLQASKHAHFFYENNFTKLILPLQLDAGHPPFFGVYLAVIWKIFGKSLVISHFAMLPSLFGIVWQLQRLIRFFLSEKNNFVALLVVLSNVTLLGQSTLVSPDIVLLFCFLLATNGILYQKKWQIILGTIGLSLLSIRGIILITALFFYQLYFFIISKRRIQKNQIVFVVSTFLPVAIIAGSYYCYHFIETGWLISTPNEGWSAHRGVVDIKGFFRKIIILGWRMLDFGIVAFWIVLFGLFIKFFKQGYKIDSKIKQIFGLPLIILLSFLPLFLLLKNPIAHRYLLPFYITFTIAVIYLVFEFVEKRRLQTLMIGFIILIQTSGHFWVYPKHIAQGWDSTLAHLPYYNLRQEMILYIDEQKIPFEQIGTEFPTTSKMKFIDLNGREEGFHKKDFENDPYILYSNIFNDFSDEELKSLEIDFEIKKQLYSNQIYMILYKRKD